MLTVTRMLLRAVGTGGQKKKLPLIAAHTQRPGRCGRGGRRLPAQAAGAFRGQAWLALLWPVVSPGHRAETSGDVGEKAYYEHGTASRDQRATR
jgi:hypothetical protein